MLVNSITQNFKKVDMYGLIHYGKKVVNYGELKNHNIKIENEYIDNKLYEKTYTVFSLDNIIEKFSLKRKNEQGKFDRIV